MLTLLISSIFSPPELCRSVFLPIHRFQAAWFIKEPLFSPSPINPCGIQFVQFSHWENSELEHKRQWKGSEAALIKGALLPSRDQGGKHRLATEYVMVKEGGLEERWSKVKNCPFRCCRCCESHIRGMFMHLYVFCTQISISSGSKTKHWVAAHNVALNHLCVFSIWGNGWCVFCLIW